VSYSKFLIKHGPELSFLFLSGCKVKSSRCRLGNGNQEHYLKMLYNLNLILPKFTMGPNLQESNFVEFTYV